MLDGIQLTKECTLPALRRKKRGLFVLFFLVIISFVIVFVFVWNVNFFEDVKIDTNRGDDPDLIDVLATVTEKPSGSFSVGAGFSSVENVIFSSSVAQNNLFGNGHRVNLTASLSSIRTNFNINLTEPRLFDSEISAGIDAFRAAKEAIELWNSENGKTKIQNKGL